MNAKQLRTYCTSKAGLEDPVGVGVCMRMTASKVQHCELDLLPLVLDLPGCIHRNTHRLENLSSRVCLPNVLHLIGSRHSDTTTTVAAKLACSSVSTRPGHLGLVYVFFLRFLPPPSRSRLTKRVDSCMAWHAREGCDHLCKLQQRLASSALARDTCHVATTLREKTEVGGTTAAAQTPWPLPVL